MLMRYGDDQVSAFRLVDHDGVGAASQEESHGTELAGSARHRHQRRHVFLEQIQSSVYCLFELEPEPRFLPVIP